jgi:hypothetical protein
MKATSTSRSAPRKSAVTESTEDHWLSGVGSAAGHIPSLAITGAVAVKDGAQAFGSGFMAGFRSAEAKRKAAHK